MNPQIPAPLPPWLRPVQSPMVQNVTGADTIDLTTDVTYFNQTVSTTSTATMSTLTSTGVLAAFTSTIAHGFTSGDVVTVSGAVQYSYNGTWIITVTSTTQFTYGLTYPTTTNATGTVTATKSTLYSVALPNGNYQRQNKRAFILGSAVANTAFFKITGTFAASTSIMLGRFGTFTASSAELEWDGSAWQLIGGSAQQSGY